MPLPPDIQTSTINELPSTGTYGPLARSDFFAVWLSAFGKTCKLSASDLLDLIQIGPGGTMQAVVLGDKILHEVTADEDGGTVVSIPTIAGQNFFLERDGYPLKTSEFSILNAGGFQITMQDANGNQDKLIKGQRFVLTLYALQGGNSSTTSPGASFFSGKKPIPTNYTMVKDDLGKLMQFRAGASQVTLTLLSVSDVPTGGIAAVESAINNTKENIIKSANGQKIYMNNQSYDSISLRVGESVWLFRDDDGWYVINGFGDVYKGLCKPYAAFSFEPNENELLCDGTAYNKSDYPRAWAKIQTLGYALVSTDTDWQANQGCFQDMSATQFRVPNLMNMFLRGVKTLGGSDDQRAYNHPGGFQNQDAKVSFADESGDNSSGGTQGTATGIHYKGGTPSDPQFYDKAKSVGTETRPVNMGVFWTIKV